jgi:hypothetical protein
MTEGHELASWTMRGEKPAARHMLDTVFPQAGAEPGLEEESPGFAATVKEPRKERTRRLDWAGLLRRTFALDVFACLRCGGRLEGPPFKVLGAYRSLGHVGLHESPRLRFSESHEQAFRVLVS